MTWLRRAAVLLPTLSLFLLAASCTNFFPGDNGQASGSTIQSVTVSPSAALLEAGATPEDTFPFTSTATTSTGSSNDTATATWTSSNAAVSVAAGVATAVGAGGQSVVITATDGGVSGTASVLTYTGTPPTALTITYPADIDNTSVAAGQTFLVTANATLNSVVTPINAYVTWTLSANTANATIDANGNLTIPAGATGAVTVTATSNLGSASTEPTVTGNVTFTI